MTSENEPKSDNTIQTREPSASSISSAHSASVGNFWTDLGLAVKKINFLEDISNIGQIPCARNSLLSGIASGVGIGFIRGMSAGPWIACNWAVGSFIFVSIGTWQICRNQLESEHRRVQVLVDSLPHLRRRRPEELEADHDRSHGINSK